jgi:hypothetical protein
MEGGFMKKRSGCLGFMGLFFIAITILIIISVNSPKEISTDGDINLTDQSSIDEILYTIKSVNIRDSGLVVYSVIIEITDENELMDIAKVIAEDKSINTLSRIYFYKPDDEYAFCFIEIPKKDAKGYTFTRLIE